MTPAQRLQLVFAACVAAATGVVSAEGWKTKAQPDPVVGEKLPTACAGVTEGVIAHHQYTEDECVQMTAQAMLKHATPILPCLPNDAKPSDAPFLGTMINTSYNVGVSKFLKSTMCVRMKAHDYAGACDAILLYRFAGGHDCRTDRVCRGVWTRRQEQRAECAKSLEPAP
jgi:lysozyme